MSAQLALGDASSCAPAWRCKLYGATSNTDTLPGTKNEEHSSCLNSSAQEHLTSQEEVSPSTPQTPLPIPAAMATEPPAWLLSMPIPTPQITATLTRRPHPPAPTDHSLHILHKANSRRPSSTPPRCWHPAARSPTTAQLYSSTTRYSLPLLRRRA